MAKTQKAYEKEIDDLEKSELVARCKALKIKPCNTGMTKLGLKMALINAKAWKKESTEKPSGKKPSAKKPAAKKPSEKKPAVKGLKCGPKVCDPGTICDASSKRGACIKRTKAGAPYGEAKLKSKYDDYFFYDEDGYLVLGNEDDVNARLSEWGVSREGKKKKEPVLASSDDGPSPPPKKKPVPPKKKPVPPKKKPAKDHPFKQKNIGCRDPFGKMRCGKDEYKDKPYCGLATGKCMKTKGRKTYVTHKINGRTFVGTKENMDLLKQYLGEKWPEEESESPVEPEPSKAVTPIKKKLSKEKREKLEQIRRKQERRYKVKCNDEVEDCDQEVCDKYYNELMKLRNTLGVKGKLDRFICPEPEDSSFDFPESDPDSVGPGFDEPGLGEIPSSSDDEQELDVPGLGEIPSSDEQELDIPGLGEIPSSDEQELDIPGLGEIPSSSDDEIGELAGPPQSVKTDDDIQKAFTKCLAMIN